MKNQICSRCGRAKVPRSQELCADCRVRARMEAERLEKAARPAGKAK